MIQEASIKASAGGKILTGSLYILTILFVLAFMWQAFSSFL